MHLTAPLYARPYLNRSYTEPTLGNALFGKRYWLITLLISVTIHFLIMHGLPWLTPLNTAPAGSAGVTASFKVLPSPAPVVSTPLPAIPPVPEIPIEPLPEPVKPTPKKKAPPKAEPVLQAKEIAQAEEFAMAEQTPDAATETIPEPTIEQTPAATQTTVPVDTQTMPSTEQQTANTLSSSTAMNNSNNSPITAVNQTARSSQDNGLLDAYGRDLQRLCEQHKQYPSIAIRRNLEGNGSVLVTFNKDGTVNSISIEQTTGQSSLDAQAIKMVEKSLKALPLPTKLSGQVLTLSVPVSFQLEG